MKTFVNVSFIDKSGDAKKLSGIPDFLTPYRSRNCLNPQDYRNGCMVKLNHIVVSPWVTGASERCRLPGPALSVAWAVLPGRCLMVETRPSEETQKSPKKKTCTSGAVISRCQALACVNGFIDSGFYAMHPAQRINHASSAVFNFLVPDISA